MREKVIYCIDCDQEVLARITEQEERYTVKGDGPFSIRAQVPVCPRCGAELFDEEIETENQRKLYGQYRRKHGLLLPEEIRAIREKYGLSQKSFSRLLGFGEITIHRYESGSIQDKAHDTIIRNAENPAFMKECYERNPQAVSRGEKKAFEEALKRFLEEEPQTPDLSRIRKAVAVVLFFAHRIPKLSLKKAYALLWYADMLHYKEFGTSITDLRYEKRLSGPVPENADFLFRMARTQGAIRVEEEPHPFLAYSQPQTMAAFLTRETIEDVLEGFSEPFRTRIYPQKEVDMSCFSPSELRVLQFLVRELGECRAGALTERIRQEKAFRETENLTFIPYHLACSLTLHLPREE